MNISEKLSHNDALAMLRSTHKSTHDQRACCKKAREVMEKKKGRLTNCNFCESLFARAFANINHFLYNPDRFRSEERRLSSLKNI